MSRRRSWRTSDPVWAVVWWDGGVWLIAGNPPALFETRDEARAWKYNNGQGNYDYRVRRYVGERMRPPR